MRIKTCLVLLFLFIAAVGQAGTTGSAFTYQGELTQLGARANGAFDFEFELFDMIAGGTSVGGPVQLEDVAVVDGVFTVELDFGSAPFDGNQLWLRLGVREGTSTGAYTSLSPRQKLTAVPYALTALNDADRDPANEIQDLELSGNTLSLTGDPTTVDLSIYLDDTDDQTLAEVLAQGNDAGGQSISNVGNLTATGTTTTNALTVTGLDCTGNANGGALTADANGVVSCSDDDDSSAVTLDAAYDQGGPGAGRTIIADAGPVVIEGDGGLVLDSGNLDQLAGDPLLLGSVGIGTNPFEVHVSGRYAYVVDEGSDDLKVIDVSDPGAPEQVGGLVIGTFPLSVYVSGRYAYVVDRDSNDLKVIDVSDPSGPSVAGSLGIGNFPRSVFVAGRYAYVVDVASNDLKVIDVSDPSAPTLAGSLAIGDFPRSVFVSGRYAYVVDGISDDLKVIDVSDPTAPILAGMPPLSIGSEPFDVYVSGRYAYVVDEGSEDLRIIDVADPSAPILAGSLALGTFPRSVHVSGSYAYVVDEETDDLKVIDVSDPTAPVIAGSLALGLNARDVYVSGRYAYVVDSGSQDLKVIDVSGAEVTSAIVHSLEAGNLQVRNDIIAQGQLQVTGGVNVGSGGIFSDGDVGIAGDATIVGDTRIEGDLTVIGSCTGCASDLNLKRNIAPIENALDRILQLRGVRYDWRPDIREARYEPGPQIGVVGQEVEAVFPELVGTDSRGYKFVRYQKLVAPLIEAVKELKARNDDVRKRIAALERQASAERDPTRPSPGSDPISKGNSALTPSEPTGN